MANIYDNRSVVGRYLRGNTVYGTGGTSPNPRGKNQHSSALRKGARIRLKRRKKGMY